jgi:hypothetical protein
MTKGTIYVDGGIRKMHGQVQGQVSVATSGPVSITGSIQYVDADGRTAMQNGLDPSGEYAANPDYTGNAMLGVMAQGDILYSKDMPADVEINASLVSVDGRVGMEGLRIELEGAAISLAPAPGTAPGDYRKNSLRRLGGIVSRYRPVSTLVDGSLAVLAGFSQAESTMDVRFLTSSDSILAPPGMLTAPLPLWFVTLAR